MGRNATIALPALPVSIIQMLQTVALNIAKTANIALDALTVFWETVLLVLAVRTVPCAFHVSKTPTWTFARCAKPPVKAVSVLLDVSLELRPLLSWKQIFWILLVRKQRQLKDRTLITKNNFFAK